MLRGAAIVLLAAGCPASAAMAGNAVPGPGPQGTWVQHHQWIQKFEPPSDPGATGSITRSVNVNTDASRKQCVPSGLSFSNPPLPAWRIGDC